MDNKRWFEAKAQDERIAALTADLAAMTEARDAVTFALNVANREIIALRAELVLAADALEAETARADYAEVKLEQAEEALGGALYKAERLTDALSSVKDAIADEDLSIAFERAVRAIRTHGEP